MQQYIILVSKYLITLCMVFYTVESYLAFLYKREEERGAVILRQNIWMFLLQLTAFVNLSLVTKDWNYVYLYGLVQIFLLTALVATRLIYPKCNRLLLNHMCMLLGIGMIILSRLSTFSESMAEKTGGPDEIIAAIANGGGVILNGLLSSKAFRQYVIIWISFLLCLLVPWILSSLKNLVKLKWLYAGAGILMLSTVLILGEVTHGSKISFTVQGITFQPSEFVKLLFVFFMAASLYCDRSMKNILFTSVIAGSHVILLVLSTDLGGALLFFVGYLTMLFIATSSYLYLLLGLTAGGSASVMAYYLFSHVRVRILAWIDPWVYIDSKGYQITQSLFAIGSGSWFGMGLYEGNPKAIPYVDVDFIFSSICEELGVVFGLLLVLVILNCFLTMMQISIAQISPFFRLICVGFGTIYIFQVFLTIGGGIKFIPLTGVTLPFISYGGSSVMATMLMFYVIQSVYMINRREVEKRRERKKQ